MTTPRMDPMVEAPIEIPHTIPDGKRRRRSFQATTSSSIYLTSVAALTVAASYLWVSPAAGFTSSSPRGSAHIYAPTSPQRYGRITPFGVQEADRRPVGSFTRLFLAAASPNSDKEEWRAILASFQLYKAAYGDMKIPTRFVVPSMKPWPGKYPF
jgi:hypothetical protein